MIDDIQVSSLQGFRKNDVKGGSGGIRVRELFLTEKQLEPYKIYEDEAILPPFRFETL